MSRSAVSDPMRRRSCTSSLSTDAPLEGRTPSVMSGCTAAGGRGGGGGGFSAVHRREVSAAVEAPLSRRRTPIVMSGWTIADGDGGGEAAFFAAGVKLRDSGYVMPGSGASGSVALLPAFSSMPPAGYQRVGKQQQSPVERRSLCGLPHGTELKLAPRRRPVSITSTTTLALKFRKSNGRATKFARWV